MIQSSMWKINGLLIKKKHKKEVKLSDRRWIKKLAIIACWFNCMEKWHHSSGVFCSHVEEDDHKKGMKEIPQL